MNCRRISFAIQISWFSASISLWR